MANIPNFKCNPCDSFKINSPFGGRIHPISGEYKNHDGIDLAPLVAGVSGDKVYAVYNGVVTRASLASGYGNLIVIEHTKFLGDKFCTGYAHLKGFNVEVGQFVYAGQIIGYMGGEKGVYGSGDSTGVHLHFELRDGSYGSYYTTKERLDPVPYMRMTKDANSGVDSSNKGYGDTFGALQTYDFPYTNYSYDKGSIKDYGKQFGRRYRILVSSQNGTTYDVSDLHCIFNIRKALVEAMSQVSYIKIYNLSPKTESNIILHGYSITIEAGYEGSNYGTIFEGNIVQVIRSKEDGTDYLLEIIAVDSARFLVSEYANLSITKGQTMRDVLVQVANRAKNPVDVGYIGTEFQKQYKRGKVMYGMASDFVEQIAKSENAYPMYDGGTLNLTTVAGIPRGEIIRINYDSGMVGAPVQTEYGVEVRTLLNPQLMLDTLIQIDIEHIVEREIQLGSVQYSDIDPDGIYRIIEVKYLGDNRGEEWYCDISTINQAGAYPSLLMSGTGYSL